ncbi:MAG TPA: efflux RND transporter periplasmic adaptor subunit [Pirellulales bacterium]|nr:efflux RND transporter periplasmic adaptor subunit [Pirellulales bacterium]
MVRPQTGCAARHAAVLGALASLCLLAPTGPTYSAEVGRAPMQLKVVRPQASREDRVTTQPGSVIPDRSARLFAKVSGYLKEQRVDIGDRVKAGDLLAAIDVPELVQAVNGATAALAQSQAQLTQAQARVETARALREAAQAAIGRSKANLESAAAALEFKQKVYRRIKQLFEDRAIEEQLVDERQDDFLAAQATRDAALAAIDSAKADLAAAEAKLSESQADVLDAEATVQVCQAALERARVFVDFAQIRSPYDGVITERTFFPGDFIRAADGSAVLPLLAVEKTDLMRVVVQVPDRDAPFTEPGDRATFEASTLPGLQFEGQVSRVSDAQDPTTRTMRVEIDLPNETGLLRDGMYGKATIHLWSASPPLTLPASCLVEKPANGKAAVYVVRDGKAHRQAIYLIHADESEIEVLSGIRAGDWVVSENAASLVEGAPVRVKQ